MSTTRSTSDHPYTIVGSSGVLRSTADGPSLAAIVLNRGGRPTRAEDLAGLEGLGFSEIIVVLDPQPHYDVEQLASRLSRTRFLMMTQPASAGVQVNLGMREVVSTHVLVTWSDINLSGLGDRTLQQVLEKEALCVVPLIRTERGSTVPSLFAPAFFGSGFRTIPTAPQVPGSNSLYPYGAIGIFDRKRFLSTGGYDGHINNPYWQQLDFGFRAHLWGESIVWVPSFRVSTTRELPSDDTTPDADYARFHLKNLSIRYSRDSARLPWRKMLRFIAGSGLGMVGGAKEFRRICRWVKENRYRFTQDAWMVTERWEVDE